MLRFVGTSGIGDLAFPYLKQRESRVKALEKNPQMCLSYWPPLISLRQQVGEDERGEGKKKSRVGGF